MSHVEAQSET